MTLRTRLALIVLALLAVGLVGAAGGTVLAVRLYLTGRADRQLALIGKALAGDVDGKLDGDGPTTAQHVTGLREVGERFWESLAADSGLPALAEVRPPAGPTVRLFAPHPTPALPSRLEPAAVTHGNPDGARYLNLDGHGSGHDWRIRVSQLPGGRGTLVVGAPMTEFQAIAHRLALIEVVVSVVTMGGMALLVRRAVRRGLRPLDEVAATAEAIGGGDLSRRVERADSRTEVGRLGLALNGMLGQIEDAFAEREEVADRLRRFVADASHELRTPVATIRGYAELFRRGAADRPDDLATAMSRIESEAARVGLLVDELLLLARLDQHRPLEQHPVDLAALAADAVADMAVLEPDRPWELRAPGPAVVDGDPTRLRQVLDNLLANVRAHTPAGTPATVEVGVDGGEVVLTVRDQGSGLPDGQCERVFERFYRADAARAKKGSGLGLAIVAAVVEAHGGRVAAANPAGGGAEFTVRLPAALPVATAGATALSGT